MAELGASPKGKDQLDDLEPDVRERMMGKLRDAAEDPEHYLEPLQGHNFFKVRAGDYRALVAWDRDLDRIAVVAAGHRSTIYDRELPPYIGNEKRLGTTAEPGSLHIH